MRETYPVSNKWGPPPPGYVPGRGRGATPLSGGVSRGEKGARNQRPEFPEKPIEAPVYDAEDREADAVWDSIDRRIGERRKEHHEKIRDNEKTRIETDRLGKARGMQAVREALTEVTKREWESLPEATMFRQKREKREMSFAVPDSILAGKDARRERGAVNVVAGAKEQLLEARLDTVAAGTGTRPSNDDKRQYLAALGARARTLDVNQRSRNVLRSLMKTDPSSPAGWLGASRLEMQSGSHSAAVSLLREGISHNCSSADLWRELLSLSGVDGAKVIINEALRYIPNDIKFWETAVDLSEPESRTEVLKKALIFLPQAISLWERAVLAAPDEESRRVVLLKAVEIVEDTDEKYLDLCWQLVDMSEYSGAKEVINKARKKNKTSMDVWVKAAQLEERNGHSERCVGLLRKAAAELVKQGMCHTGEDWLERATRCEREGRPETCRALVSLRVEADNSAESILQDSKRLRGQFSGTADALLEEACGSGRVGMTELWLERARNGEAVEVLRLGTRTVPSAPELWLALSNALWREQKDAVAAIKELREALRRCPLDNNLAVALLLSKILMLNGLWQESREALSSLDQTAEAVFIARIDSLRREFYVTGVGADVLWDTADRAVEAVSSSWRLWELRARVSGEVGSEVSRQGELWLAATKKFPRQIRLTCAAVETLTGLGLFKLALKMEQDALILNPRAPGLLLLQCDTLQKLQYNAETEQQRTAAAGQRITAIASAVRHAPSCGAAWRLAVQTAEPRKRATLVSEAIQKCRDALVVWSGAEVMVAEGREAKAREWFEEAVALDGSNCDIWRSFLAFEEGAGEQERAANIITRIENNIMNGTMTSGTDWLRFSSSVENWALGPAEALRKFLEWSEKSSADLSLLT